MKRILFTILIAIVYLQAFSQSEKYSRVSIASDPKLMVKLLQSGIAAEDGYVNKDKNFIIDLSESEIAQLKTAGISYSVVIDDVKKYYRERNLADTISTEKVKSLSCFNPPQIPTPAGFSLGSMGGFYTWQQILDKLDALALQYPNLISVKHAADTTKTIEGRTIYYVKVSDNPNVDENEPQVLYTAITHAREAVGMQQLFFYICYLLENYNTNNDIKNIVDNTEMYFIPCVNPDGYIYNETTDPTGGGMWRKNRRNSGGGNYGIDLNRNFGYMWGYDNIGSSPNAYDDTYRGSAAFSEPESRVVRNFCNAHQIKLTLNHHAFANDFIYPWGYIGSLYTPDSLLFEEYAKLLTRDNYFAYGTADQTIGYVTNGSFDDWMYGFQSSKPKIMSMTPESGDPTDGFWPTTSRIPEICRGNVTMNLMAAKLVGKYATAEDLSPLYISQQSGYFDFSIERLGLDSPATFTVSIQPISANITSVGSPKVFSGMSLLEKRNDSISYTLDPTIHNGDKIKYLLKVDNGLYIHSDTITRVYGPSFLIFSDNCSNTNNWYATSGWDITTEAYYSGPTSITDSPYSNYADNTDESIETIVPVNLTNALSAYLTFEGKWSVEAGADYVQVKASTDNGSSWTPLCGKYTKPGNTVQAVGEPLYDGYQGTWVKEEINLDDYLGQHVLFQYSLRSDNYTNFDGFYFDDFKVYALYDSSNAIPEQSIPLCYLSEPMPNPATDETSIIYRLPEMSGKAIFSLTDMCGRIVYSKAIESPYGVIKINSIDLSSGLYHYSIVSGTYRSEVKKIVINSH